MFRSGRTWRPDRIYAMNHIHAKGGAGVPATPFAGIR